jgi:hypothetical protein
VIAKRYIRLMNAEIDGANSPEESRELREYLDANEEAREHFEELKAVGVAMAEAGQVSPPEGLRAAIMRIVRQRERARARGGFVEWVRQGLSPAPRMRLAYSFAGGVAVGLVLFAILSMTLPQLAMVPGDGRELMGTMGGERCFVAADAVDFEVPGAAGSASVRYCAETVTLQLSLESESEVVVILSYDEEVDFDGLRAYQAGDHAIAVTGNRAELTHAGMRDYDLYFTDCTESHLPLRMRVESGGRSLFESNVPPGRE